MELLDTSAFEKRLRMLIEAGSLDAADAFIRDVVDQPGDTPLRDALDCRLDKMAIENWASIAADMEDAKRYLSPTDANKDWQAVFVGLVNNTETDGLRAKIEFGVDAEPAKPTTSYRPNYMTDAEFEAFERELAERTFLPKGQRYGAGDGPPGLRITGLDDLYAIECATARDDESSDERERRWRKQTLAAAIILLQFHRLVERYATNPGLPQPKTLFVHVARVSGPMEGNYEFGTDATRALLAAGDRFDHAAAARRRGPNPRSAGVLQPRYAPHHF